MQVKGHAYYTGKSKFVIEDNDPLKKGFLVRWMIWSVNAGNCFFSKNANWLWFENDAKTCQKCINA